MNQLLTPIIGTQQRCGATGCARYIGRVGALAVALGIGVAVSTSTQGIAYAETPSETSQTSSESSTDDKEPTSTAAASTASIAPDTNPLAQLRPRPGKRFTDAGRPDRASARFISPNAADGDNAIIGGLRRVETQMRHSLTESTSGTDDPVGRRVRTALEPLMRNGDIEKTVESGIEARKRPSPLTELTERVLTVGADGPRADRRQAATWVQRPRTGIDVHSSADNHTDIDRSAVPAPATPDAQAPDLTVARTAVQAQAEALMSAQAPPVAPAEHVRPVRALMVATLTLFGYNPLAAPVPGAPTSDAFLVAVWGLYRRLESFIANETPTLGTPTVSSTLNSDGQITGNLNVSDYDGDILTYQSTDGAHGTVQVNQDGTFAYTPDSGYVGADTFTVTVSDDTNPHFHIHPLDWVRGIHTQHDATQTVTVVVPGTTVNAPPVVTVVSGPGTPGADGTVRGTFTVTDPNGDDVDVTVDPAGRPTHGDVQITRDATGLYTWTYTPTQAEQIKLGLSGGTLTDGFTLSATDNVNAPVTTEVSGISVAPAYLSVDTPIQLDAAASNVTVNADGTRAYVVDSTNDKVVVVNLSDGTVVNSYTVGDYPVGVAVHSDGRLYVSNSDSNSVSVIDTSGTVTDIALADSPGVASVSADGAHVYVPLADGTIAVINTSNNSVTSTINFAARSVTFAGNDSSKIYAIGGQKVAVIDAATGAVLDTVTTDGVPVSVAVSDDGTRAYVTTLLDSALVVVDTSDPTNLTEVGKIAMPPVSSGVPNEPTNVALSPDGSLAYVATLGGRVFVVDTATNTLLSGATVTLPDQPHGLVTSPNGTHVYTANTTTETLAVLTLKPGTDTNQSPVISVVAPPSAPNGDGVVTGSFRVTDPDGDPVTVSTGRPANGTLDLDYNAATGVYTWSYTPTEAGRLVSGLSSTTLTDGFTVSATDGTSAPARATLSGIAVVPTHLTVDQSAGGVKGTQSAVALSDDGTRAYVTDKTNDTVTVVNLTTGQVLATYTVADAPSSIAVGPGGRLYVGHSQGVDVVDTAGGTVKSLSVGDGVRQVVVSPDGATVYATKVGYVSPGIVVIDTATDTVTTTFGYPAGHLAFAGDDSSKIYATDTLGNAITVLDASTGSILGVTYVIGAPGALAVSDDGTRAYVTTPDAIKVYDVSDPTHMTVVKTIALQNVPNTIVLSPDGSLAYLTSGQTGRVTVVDLANGTVLGTGTNAAGAHSAAALSADGRYLYATNTTTHKLSVIELNPGANVNQAPVITVVYAPTAPTTDGVVYGSYVVADPDGDPITVSNNVVPTTGGFTIDYDPVAGVYHWAYRPTQANQVRSGLAVTQLTDVFSVDATDGTNASVQGVNLLVPEIHFESGTSLSAAGYPAGVAVSADGTRAYVIDQGQANGDPNTVRVIDLATGAVEAEYTVEDSPETLAVTHDGSTIYVSNAGSGTVSVIDTASGTVTSVDVAGQPVRVVLSANGEKLYVATASGGIKVVDTATKTLLTAQTVNVPAIDIALSPDGTKLYALNRNGTLATIDTATGTVTKQQSINTNIAVVRFLTVSPDGERLYASYGFPSKVGIYDADTLDLITAVSVAGIPMDLAVSPDSSLVYVTDATGGVTVIDAATRTVISTPAYVNNPTYRLAVSPDGTHVYLVDTNNSEVDQLVLVPGSGSVYS